jgi:transposase
MAQNLGMILSYENSFSSITFRGISVQRFSHFQKNQGPISRAESAGCQSRTTSKKTICGVCGKVYYSWYDSRFKQSRDLSDGDHPVYIEVEVRRIFCKHCKAVKQERLEILSKNTKFTQRLALSIGGLCRTMTIQDVATRMDLDRRTVKELEKEYMREQLRKIGEAKPTAIGVDEISIKKGSQYRIIVSDLHKHRPIWFGGHDRFEESMDEFYEWLGSRRRKRIKLVVMDMWKPFRKSARKYLPETTKIMIDKFHLMSPLSKAFGNIQKDDYYKLGWKKRLKIKGRRRILLSNRENLTIEDQQKLGLLLNNSRSLKKAYLLKESFDRFWKYKTARGAWKYLKKWKASARSFSDYQSFVRTMERNWNEIAPYFEIKNKVPLGYVEGFNNKIRVIQRKCYGLHDEEYLRLKILTSALSEEGSKNISF